MGLKMKNYNILGVHHFLGEGGHKKTMYRGNLLGQFAGDLAKKREEGVFDEGEGLIAWCKRWISSGTCDKTWDKTC